MTEAMVIVLYEQNIYTIEQGKVQVRTFQVGSFACREMPHS